MKRRITKQQAEFMLRAYVQVHKPRKVGDEVKVYQQPGVTSKIAKIEGEVVTLENGNTMHISNCRDPDYDPFRR